MAKFLDFFRDLSFGKNPMMTTIYSACDLSSVRQGESAVVQVGRAIALPGGASSGPSQKKSTEKEEVRHILLGSAGAVRQTIYLLHSLRYSEPALWTPLSPVRGQMMISATQGEMMSLLQRSV